MPFQLPAHILQDALALSTPVGAADEPLLCEHIIQGIKRGENYKAILNGLHGVGFDGRVSCLPHKLTER